MSVEVLILGCGFAGSAVARRARSESRSVLATVRSEERARALREVGYTVSTEPLDAIIEAAIGERTHVVIAFPPDGRTDALIAPAIAHARCATYISSTGVYGDRTGRIDDRTPLAAQPSERARRILEAEQLYRERGATVLRCPGIYGADRGLHRRVIAGQHRVPGDGSRTLSRIHVEDLASFVLASAEKRGETYVVGDLAPAPQREVIAFICAEYGVPFPASVPLEEVHETLRADRAVDSSRALRELGVKLRYPSYRDGMARKLEA